MDDSKNMEHKCKIAVLSASLGNFDKSIKHTDQSIEYDYFVFTDENFPPRFKSITSRLQAKVPKFFGWQLTPGYDYYIWLDGNIIMTDTDTIKYFYDSCQGYDMVVFRHPSRPNIRQEVRYTRKGINQESLYMLGRYQNEWLKEQNEAIESDKDYVDDLLLSGGAFMYRSNSDVQNMFKEWWYNVSRYIIQDQIAFPYVLKKSGIKFNIRSDNIFENKYLKTKRHRNRAR